MKRKLIIALTLAGIFQFPAWAARPLSTDDAGTLERGRSESEWSFDYCRYRPDGTCRASGISVKHGFTENLDFGLSFSYSTEKDESGNSTVWGMSPLEMAFKLAFLKDKGAFPDVSLSAEVQPGSTGYGINLILSRAYGGLGLHYNLGYNSSGLAMTKGSIATSMAAEYAVTEKLRVCGELNGEVRDDGAEVLENSGLVGSSIAWGSVAWDLGIRIHDQRGPRATITTGITVGF